MKEGTIVKPAATVLLTRETAENSVEVLLLRRNRKLKFGPGFWVFPGGKVEPYEQEGNSEIKAAELSAIRETMEETGLTIHSDDLTFFVHWTTPEPQKIRFGTWFFLAQLKNPSQPVIIDDSEIKDHVWISPKEALQKMNAGQLNMMPPTFMCLNRIALAQSYIDVKALLTAHAPSYILPTIVFHQEEVYCLYEGDSAFENRDVTMDGPMHRLVSDSKFESYRFEYEGCDSIPPVNGHGRKVVV